MKEAVILAGGFGTRLQSLGFNEPKPMLKIQGFPILEHILNFLSKSNFRHVILSTGFKHIQIYDYFGHKYKDIKISYSFEERPLGTGGAIIKAARNIKNDHFYVFNGDTYSDIDLYELEEEWLKSKQPILVGKEVEDTNRYGRLVVEKGRIINIQEKQNIGPGCINLGCYILIKELFSEYLLDKNYSFEKDLLPNIIKNNNFLFFNHTGSFIDIGIPDDYHKAQNFNFFN